jgi:glycosyltransferase involved in cell wall biosynthesis
MRIAVDGYELNSTFTGVGRFLANLLNALAMIDKNNTYTVFLKEAYELPGDPGNMETIVLRSERTHTRWQNSHLKKALSRGKFDLFFSPNHSVPIFYNRPSVMTIHDVSWKAVPGDFSAKEQVTRDLKTRLSIRKSVLVFTISEFSKNEILKYYRVSPEKIIPVHHGIEDRFSRSSGKEIRSFRKKYGLGRSRVIGFLGSMFGRRHIDDIINSFSLLKKEMDIKLFLAGANLYKTELKGLYDEGIIYIDRLPEEEINAFYSSMDLFLYLSEYEGFGFPPLEALSCGTVSLLLESSSLTEIYTNLAFFTSAPDPVSLSLTIMDILARRELESAQILDRFRIKKKYFSWERAAREFLKYFNAQGS